MRRDSLSARPYRVGSWRLGFVFRRPGASLVTLLVGAALVVSCSSDAAVATPSDDRIAECDGYVAALQACAGRGGAAAVQAMEAQTATIRDALTRAATQPGKREAIRARCDVGRQALASSCGAVAVVAR